MSQGTSAIAAVFFQFSNISNTNNCFTENADCVECCKNPLASIFLLLCLRLHTKYNGQLIAPDLHLAVQNLTECQRLDTAEETVFKALLQKKNKIKRKQQKPNHCIYKSQNLWTTLNYALFRISLCLFLCLSSGTPLRLPVDSANH